MIQYSRKLARWYLGRRHRWLLIKSKRGKLILPEQKELAQLEANFEANSMSVNSPADDALAEFTDEEVLELEELFK